VGIVSVGGVSAVELALAGVAVFDDGMRLEPTTSGNSRSGGGVWRRQPIVEPNNTVIPNKKGWKARMSTVRA
jgi:hypothetical protein